MKHITITLVCLVLIAVYTISAYIYIDNFHREMSEEIINTENTVLTAEKVERLKDTFTQNKKCLIVMVNEELVEETETLLTQLEYAVEYNNMQDIKTCCALILNNVGEIKRTSHTLF